MNKKSIVLAFALLLLLSTFLQFNMPILSAAQPPIDTTTYYKGTTGQPRRVDPARAYDTASGELISNVYETLIFFADKPLMPDTTAEVTPDKVADLSKFEPKLAAALPTISPDRKTWTFTIKSGIKFHPWTKADGTVVTGQIMTAEDVEYSFKRMLVQDQIGSPQWMIALPLTGYMFFDDIADDENLVAQLINNAITRSGNTVTFHFVDAWPQAAMMQIFSQTWGSIVNKAFCIEHGCWDGSFALGWMANYRRKPSNSYSPLDNYAAKSKYTSASSVPTMCGTGPYKFNYWNKATLEWRIDKFDDYWGGWAGNRLNTIIVQGVAEWSTRKMQFLAGEFDSVAVPRTNMWDLLDPSDPTGHTPLSGITLYYNAPALRNNAVLFNFHVAPDSPYMSKVPAGGDPAPDLFANVHMRRAFAHSLDFTKYLEDACFNEAIQPTTWWVKGLFPDYENKSIPKFVIDLAKVEAELKATEVNGKNIWDSGFETYIEYSGGSYTARMIRDTIQSLNAKRTGKPAIKINLVGLASLEEAYLMPVFFAGWIADFPDPDNFVRPYMHSQGDFAYSQGYSDPHVDELIDMGIIMPDGPARAAVYNELQYIYCRDVPSFSFAQYLERGWQRDWVRGWYYNQLYPGPYFYDIYKAVGAPPPPPPKEVIDIPMIVNVLEGVDNKKYDDKWIEDRVKEMNEILKQADVHFTLVAKPNRNVADPDGTPDGRVDVDVAKRGAPKTAGDTLRGQGEIELWKDKNVGVGKGYKVTLVNGFNDLNLYAGSMDWKSVSLIRVDAPQSQKSGGKDVGAGATWAHEWVHTVIVGYPQYDDHEKMDNDNLMKSPPAKRTDTKLTEEQIEIIRFNAKNRAKSTGSKKSPYSYHWHYSSAVLDELDDTMDKDGFTVTGFDYVDLASAQLSSYDPRTYLQVIMSLKGLPAENKSTSLMFNVTLNTDNRIDTGLNIGTFTGIDKIISIQLTDIYPFTAKATLIDTDTGSILNLDPPEVFMQYFLNELEEGYPLERRPVTYTVRLNVSATYLGPLAESIFTGFILRDLGSSVSDSSNLTFSTIVPPRPEIQIDPTDALPGQKLSINGILFTPSNLVTIKFNDEEVGNWTTDNAGSFHAEVAVPPIPTGHYLLEAVDSEGKYGYTIVTVIYDGPVQPVDISAVGSIQAVGGSKLKRTPDGSKMTALSVEMTIHRLDSNPAVASVFCIMALNRTGVTTGYSQIIAGADALVVLTLGVPDHTEDFLWNETSFGGTLSPGNYTLSGVVNVISSFAFDNNPVNNLVVVAGGPITVTVLWGDIDNNGIVNILDVFTVARAFGADSESPRWNPVADLNGDGVVNILDVFTVARQFGQTL